LGANSTLREKSGNAIRLRELDSEEELAYSGIMRFWGGGSDLYPPKFLLSHRRDNSILDNPR
jgi:hypothetical protein